MFDTIQTGKLRVRSQAGFARLQRLEGSVREEFVVLTSSQRRIEDTTTRSDKTGTGGFEVAMACHSTNMALLALSYLLVAS